MRVPGADKLDTTSGLARILPGGGGQACPGGEGAVAPPSGYAPGYNGGGTGGPQKLAN